MTRLDDKGGASAGSTSFDVVIVGGGAAGLATAASLLARRAKLKIAVIEPRTTHDYQPGWTMVGAGVFELDETRREEAALMPRQAEWLKTSAKTFAPDRNTVELEDGRSVTYRALVVAPGLKLDWDGIDGLKASLGSNGVTSNYSRDYAAYTWELVQSLKSGAALFTQPAMPIKCAGAPQKAMYLSCSEWQAAGRLKNIKVEFHNTGAVLFGVAQYVPALMEYVERYGIDLAFESKLVAVDGHNRRATFEQKGTDGKTVRVEKPFDMLHVCPPQSAPDVVAKSPLAGAGGWTEVDQASLRHVRYANVFGLGDACSAPNAKTAAAARKQAPVVAANVIAMLDGRPLNAVYNGYGSCPLTVEKGKIVLAEFGYGGKLLPSFPAVILDGTRPTHAAWLLKKDALPFIYWNAMLKGREWMAGPSFSKSA
ncbi:MAG: NAD(P)/FAD-dependent oxidoreductase [Caulobacteraceae bacterium]